jgi:hypothetical protein
MTNCPFSKRRAESRVVVKVNWVSVQWWTLSTRSVPTAANVNRLRDRLKPEMLPGLVRRRLNFALGRHSWRE